MNANTISNLLWFVGIGGLFYLMMRGGGCGGHRHGGTGSHQHGSHEGGDARQNDAGGSSSASPGVARQPPGAALLDPVCGMPVASPSPALQRTYMDRSFHFCSPDCMRKFDADPSKYVGAPGPAEHRRHTHGC